ncbi:MAG: GNAT family N-acetyltransferase [Proteobacteria bacterium]|nr:GNAT family N-acetyltransferase [Pseudomonadota bacterium]
MTTVSLRPATADDRPFIDGLSPRLSRVPGPPWHDTAAMDGFQDRHMAVSFAPADGSSTVIAQNESGRRLGYIHLRPGKDGVTEEPCGYISLLAVTPKAEGLGVAAKLMAAAETWARSRGYRLLSLDVFAHNKRAVDFYERGGFTSETFRMVKPL